MTTEPYEYQGIYLVEQTYPIVIDGELRGIAGADRSLEDLGQRLEGELPYPEADVLLISARGRIIANTIDPTLDTRVIESTPEMITAVERWAEWATETVEAWPDDVRSAEPDLETLEAMAVQAETHEPRVERVG